MEKADDVLERKQWSYMLKSSIAGGMAGVVAKTFTAPLDRIKILFQGYNPVYKRHMGTPFGVFKAAIHIQETHGVRGLFQGHSATLMRIFPSAAIRFMSYEQFRMFLIPPDLSSDKHRAWRHFVAGSLAGNVAVLTTYPLEVIRARMAFEIRTHSEVETQKRYHILETVKSIYREAGYSIRGFYKGFGATMLGVIPYAGSAFMSYQWMKEKCLGGAEEWLARWTVKKSETATNGQKKRELNLPTHLLIGGLAGMVGQTAAYPLDTVRHRMQLYGLSPDIRSYRNTWDALVTIMRREGWRSLFVGVTINYWKTMPANAIAFVAYEKGKKLMGI